LSLVWVHWWRLRELGFPDVGCCLLVHVAENMVKDLRIPADSMAFDPFLDILKRTIRQKEE